MGVKVMKVEGQNIKVGLALFRGADSAAVSFSFLQIEEGWGKFKATARNKIGVDTPPLGFP